MVQQAFDSRSTREGRPFLQGCPPASGLALYLLLTIAAALLFGLWPGLDIEVSAWARQVSGGRFQTQDGWWWWLYAGIRPLVLGFSALVVCLGAGSWWLDRPLVGITPRRALFVVTTFLLTQGLLVDRYLKTVFGRARPRDLTEFGGDLRFTPFYVVSDQCEKNCSFVSGHASMAFASYVLVFLVPARLRLQAFIVATIFGLVMGYMRILQGGHFLSDVVFAGLVVFGSTWLLAWLFLRSERR